MISVNNSKGIPGNHGNDKGDCLVRTNTGKQGGNEGFENAIVAARVQAKFRLDIERIAKLMGIGPQTLLAVIGDLKIDPQNYDFKVETNVDAAVNSVAQYFGISPMTMLAVFDKLGINKIDLVNRKKTGEIILKLKDFFGLSMEQQRELADLLKEFIEKDE